MSHRLGQSRQSLMRPVPRELSMHHGGNSDARAAMFSRWNRMRVGTVMPQQYLEARATGFVRVCVAKLCPPDMSGHGSDTIPDIKIDDFGRKTGVGCPDIVPGHALKLVFANDLSSISGGQVSPLCPDMNKCARGTNLTGTKGNMPASAMATRPPRYWAGCLRHERGSGSLLLQVVRSRFFHFKFRRSIVMLCPFQRGARSFLPIGGAACIPFACKRFDSIGGHGILVLRSDPVEPYRPRVFRWFEPAQWHASRLSDPCSTKFADAGPVSDCCACRLLEGRWRDDVHPRFGSRSLGNRGCVAGAAVAVRQTTAECDGAFCQGNQGIPRGNPRHQGTGDSWAFAGPAIGTGRTHRPSRSCSERIDIGLKSPMDRCVERDRAVWRAEVVRSPETMKPADRVGQVKQTRGNQGCISQS